MSAMVKRERERGRSKGLPRAKGNARCEQLKGDDACGRAATQVRNAVRSAASSVDEPGTAVAGSFK